MTHFDDLSPYTYIHPEEDAPNTVNVGWLDVRHPFRTGKTDYEFQRKLQRLCRRRFKQTRGFLPCYFCKGEDRPISSSEIRIASAGTVFAAPSLVYHYVAAHDYRPPDEFISAVLEWNETDNDTVGWRLVFKNEA